MSSGRLVVLQVELSLPTVRCDAKETLLLMVIVDFKPDATGRVSWCLNSSGHLSAVTCNGVTEPCRRGVVPKSCESIEHLPATCGPLGLDNMVRSSSPGAALKRHGRTHRATQFSNRKYRRWPWQADLKYHFLGRKKTRAPRSSLTKVSQPLKRSDRRNQ
jgi:hypothetical protein